MALGGGCTDDKDSLKCLSARFVIDIRVAGLGDLDGGARLKCLSARFVIDIL